MVREGEKEGGVEAIDAEERARNETLEREKLGIEKTKTESVWSVVEIDWIIMMSERKSLDFSFSFNTEDLYFTCVLLLDFGAKFTL